MKGINPAAFDPGTATISPSKRPALRPEMVAARAFPSRLAALLPHPLTVAVWGLETKSEQNERGHWAVKAKRVKKQREAVAAALLDFRSLLEAVGAEVNAHGGQVRVTLTRQGRRKFDDDGCVASLKAVRDQVAAAMGVNDGNPAVRWVTDPKQRLGEPAVYVTLEACGQEADSCG